jgi:ABC-type phosphate/phosphonate transport system permease subunit
MNRSFFWGVSAGMGASAIISLLCIWSGATSGKIIKNVAEKAADQQVENLKEKVKSKLQDYLK